MARLIDADLLRKNMEFICMGIMAGTDPYNAPLTEIDNAPTVDVIPQGEWIIDGHHIRCNRCNEYICNTDREGNEIPNNYCPNCGADMREVEE